VQRGKPGDSNYWARSRTRAEGPGRGEEIVEKGAGEWEENKKEEQSRRSKKKDELKQEEGKEPEGPQEHKIRKKRSGECKREMARDNQRRGDVEGKGTTKEIKRKSKGGSQSVEKGSMKTALFCGWTGRIRGKKGD